MCYDHLCNLEVTWYVLGIPRSSHGDHVAEGGCSEHTSRWYVMRSNEEFPVAGTRYNDPLRQPHMHIDRDAILRDHLVADKIPPLS
jgi:hypothetical protein